MLRPTGAFGESPVRNLLPKEKANINFAGDALVEIDIPVAGRDEVVIAFDDLCLLPGEGQRGETMGFKGTVIAVGSDVEQWKAGTPLCGIAPRMTNTVVALPVAQIAAVECDQAFHDAEVLARIGLIDVGVRRLTTGLDIKTGERALVCETVYGGALATALAQRGVEVTRIGSDTTSWILESREFDADQFALIAAPVEAFARIIGFRALQIGGQVIDLDVRPSAMTVDRRIGYLQRIGFRVDNIDAGFVQDLRRALLDAPLDSVDMAAVRLENWSESTTSARDFTHLHIARSRSLEIATHGQPRFDRRRTYLVTGGLGGLGQHTALWLACHGAGHIVVCGRRGADTPGADALLDAIASMGATGEARKLDTADTAQVASLVAALDGDDHRLAGVFHAAGILEDKPSLALDVDDLGKVMTPKAGGAWSLHQATRNLKLDHFVMYSSMSAIVGNSRQANYCAANGFMDGLAHLRRGMGLSATSINFGAISGAGMAADQKVLTHLRAAGLPPLAVDRALSGLGVALEQGQIQIVVAETLDLNRWIKYEARCAHTAKMYEITEPFLNKTDDGRVTAIKKHLSEASPQQRMDAVSTLLIEIVANDLKLDANKISCDHALSLLGVDSLMAMDIQLSIEKAFAVNISTMVLMGGATIAGIAAKILAEFGFASESPTQDHHAA